MSFSEISGWNSILSEPSNLPFQYTTGFKIPTEEGLSCKVHNHASIEIVYHRMGTGSTRFGTDGSLSFSEGDCILYPPEVPHDQWMDSPGEDLCIQIAVPQGVFHGTENPLRLRGSTDWIRSSLDVLTEGSPTPDDLQRRILDLKASALLLEMLRLYRSSQETALSKHASIVLRCEEYLRNHFREVESIEAVAPVVGISYDRLRHIYQIERGHSIIHYLTHIRMERAKSLLLTSNMGLKQIAPLCGYRDPYYFSAAFNRAIGIRPSEYRSSHTAGSQQS